MKCFISGKECEYQTNINHLSVFVLSPFGYPFDDVYKNGICRIVKKIEYEEIYEQKKSPLPGHTLETGRADQILQLGFVMCQKICRRIQQAEFIIADISKPNPNVFYELGLSYGLKKKIILIGQKTLDEALTFGLVKNSESYVHYRTLEDFTKKGMFLRAFKNPVMNTLTGPDMPESVILNIINVNNTIPGLHEKVFKDSILEINGKSEDLRLKDENWKVVTQSISMNTKISEIINYFLGCKVCVIDSSSYGKRETDSNPYLFFALGLGHGLQKEVVPITLTGKPATSNILPFDVRGLWHIFFKDLEELKNQFMNIMPKIDEGLYFEKQDSLYKKIWGPFLKNRELHIMTCARDTEEEHRGRRTNIDKWDYTAVSELTHFLALKYPNARVNISGLKSKLLNIDIEKSGKEEIKKDIAEHLMDKDCIIIGSPDVSDLAEIVSANLHKIEPYEKDRLRFNGYVMIKTLQPDKTSSFYWQKKDDEKEGICLYEEESGVYTSNTNTTDSDGLKVNYGILTIANNPFVPPGQKRKIMIFSGFSGIATYAIAKLLTDEKYKDELIKLDKSYLNRDKNVEILIGTKFSEDSASVQKGDNRTFKDVFFKHIITI